MRSVGNIRAEVGESPVWDPVAGALWWVDVWARRVIRSRPDRDEHRIFRMPEMVGAVVPTPAGAVVGLETGLFTLELGTGEWALLSTPPNHPASHRFNDAVVDPRGRLIISTMLKSQLGAEPSGMLLSYSKGEWRLLSDGFWTANGLAFSPDGRTLYVSDSHPYVQTIWTHDYEPSTGALGARREFANLHALEGRPDGAAVDREGGYWIAGVSGGCVYRYAPDGRLIETIAAPVENPTKVAFGGADLRTAYVTSMSVRLTRPDPQQVAGALLAFSTSVGGLPPDVFGG